jgi:hypothetical protein
MESQSTVNRKILDGYSFIYSGWFKNLSNIFLSIHIPKILLTAEKERMDK